MYGLAGYPLAHYDTRYGTTAAPTMNDIKTIGAAALPSSHYDIRDTSNHWWIIPQWRAGFRATAIGIKIPTAFDQTLSVSLYMAGSKTNIVTGPNALLLTGLTVPISTALDCMITPGAPGLGGLVGDASVGDADHYQVSAMLYAPVLALLIKAGSTPASGTLEVEVTRLA